MKKKNDKTVYSNVDLSIRVSPLPLADKDSDSDDKDDDFMYVDNIKKYTMKRSTQQTDMDCSSRMQKKKQHFFTVCHKQKKSQGTDHA
jgi:hypothetical protein